MSRRSQKVLVVLPTYNEKDTIEEVIRGIFSNVSTKTKYQVLVVDDNSPDGTANIVTRLARSNSNIFMISGSKNGLGEAYKRGFIYALSNLEFDDLVMMDADLSHDPAEIPKLINCLNSGRDVAIGSRYITGGMIPGNWPILRILNTRVAHFVAKFVGGIETETKELTGGFKAINKSALTRVNFQEAKASGYGFQLFLSNQFVAQNLKVSEIPILFRDRKAGQSKLGTMDILEFILISLRLNPTSPFKRMAVIIGIGLIDILLLLLTTQTTIFLDLLLIFLVTAFLVYFSQKAGIFKNRPLPSINLVRSRLYIQRKLGRS